MSDNGLYHRHLLLRQSQLLIIAVTLTVQSTTCSQQPPQQIRQASSHQCGLYLAPSSIPNAGLGMYLGHNTNALVKQGDVLLPRPRNIGEVEIPIFELDFHNNDIVDTDDDRPPPPLTESQFIWRDYGWMPDTDEMQHEIWDGTENVEIACGGFGAIPNCHLPLVNIGDLADWLKVQQKRRQYNNVSLRKQLRNYQRTKTGYSGIYGDYDNTSSTTTITTTTSPRTPDVVGAFTPYYGRQIYALRDLEPGSELYIDYSQDYFRTREEYADVVPLFKDYRDADRLLKGFINLTTTNKNSENIFNDLWEAVRAILSIRFGSSRKPNNKHNTLRVLNALPKTHTINYFQTIIDEGGTKNMHYNTSIQTLDWLEENGQCMDNIKDGISTIPNAGRGAFATRFIPEGELVAPAPLIQIYNRNILTMYERKLIKILDEEGNLQTIATRDVTKPIGYQLLVNYCFGHNSTTMLLCPYGMLTALINHAPGKKANTKIQWSTKNQMMRHPEWINQSISEFQHISHTGLSFDFVALRDIEESEEILIDYGIEWENAWQKHVVASSSLRHPKYIPAFEMNKIHDLHISTVDEFSYEYIFGIHTFCRIEYIEFNGLPLQKYFRQHSYYYESRDDPEAHSVPCRVLQRLVKTSLDDDGTEKGHNNQDTRYIAELWGDIELGDPYTGEGGRREVVLNHIVIGILFDIPRDAFHFTDSPYSRAHHQESAFRHDMRIPDDMFPPKWRNG